MRYQWVRKPAWIGLGVSGVLAVILSGCGGETADKGDAVLVNAPDAKTSANTSTRSGGGGAKASTETANADKATSAAPVKAEGWGTFKGQITFGGSPPQAGVLEAVGKAQKDPEVCAKTTPIVDEKLVVNASSKGVKNVFVYLQRPTAVNDDAKKAALAEKREFDQKNCTYIPHALGVMVGETVTLKSSDPTNHNVNFQLKNLSQNPLLAPGKSMDITPDSPERAPGPVSCSIHPWMKAYWLVLDHPYFAVTDENGNFEIKNAPAGTQKVVVWQETVGGGGYVTPASGESVNIAANGTTTKNFTIDPAKVQ